MNPNDLPRHARIGLLSRQFLVAADLAASVGAGEMRAHWDMQVMATPQPADAYLLHEPDAALWALLPAGVPVVAIGGVAPAGDTRPLALLAPAADTALVQAALAAVLQGLMVRDPARPREQDATAATAATAAAALAADTEPLTEREIQVMELIAKGLTNRDIGGLLGISTHTVKFHVAQVLAKLGASSRAEAVSTALRFGLIGL